MSGLLTYRPGGEMLIPCDVHGEHAATIPLGDGFACLECAKEAYQNAVRLTAENADLRADVAALGRINVRAISKSETDALHIYALEEGVKNYERRIDVLLARLSRVREAVEKMPLADSREVRSALDEG
jgi:hypothetical protein